MSVFNKNILRVLSYDVLRQQKTRVMTRGVLSGGGVISSPVYNVEPVTNTSSLSCATDAAVSARRLPPSVAALFFTLRDSHG